MKKIIICIGNRFFANDSVGPAVYDRLQQVQPLPEGIEIIDGGLGGLNLLPLLEQGGRVVFVDAVSGYGPPGQIVLLDRQEIMNTMHECRFDHNAGLAYLLAVLPNVCDGKLPEEIVLVGLEGEYTQQLVERASSLCLDVAANGLRDLR
jgi:hydrogenase maturation protease